MYCVSAVHGTEMYMYTCTCSHTPHVWMVYEHVTMHLQPCAHYNHVNMLQHLHGFSVHTCAL